MKAMNNKTSTHIEVVNVDNTGFVGATIIVRPPAYLQCFRCTVIFQTLGHGSIGLLSTVTPQNLMNVLRFSNRETTTVGVPPSNDETVHPGIQSFVFDRLGVGYMVENFYVSAANKQEGEQFVFIWEGNIQST